MTAIQSEIEKLGITRLCHFTQSRNMAHIFGDCYGILSTEKLIKEDLPYNPTDPNRYDGCDHLVCCTIEYPNIYYFNVARNKDTLFKDWVVIFIKPDLIWAEGTMFCQCNAAKGSGAYVHEGYDAFASLFENNVLGFSRNANHLKCSPTNLQAETLVPGPIPLNAITGIAVESPEQAERELLRARLQGLSLDKPIFVIPEFYDKNKLTYLIRNGKRVEEKRYQ